VPAAAQHKGPHSHPDTLSGCDKHSEMGQQSWHLPGGGSSQGQEKGVLLFGYALSSYWEWDIWDDLHTRFPTAGVVKTNRSPIMQVLESFLSSLPMANKGP